MDKKTGLGIYTFSDDASKTLDKLVSRKDEAKDLLYWVERGSIVLIKGPKKSGKTRLAFEIIEKFRGKGKVIYIDLDTYNKEIDVGHLIIGNQSFFRRIRNKMPKNMILIVDNAHSLDNDFYRRLQFFFDQGYLRSVVFVKKSGAKLELPKSIDSRIGHCILDLKPLSKDEWLEIIGNRVRSLFAKEHLKKVWDNSSDLSNFLKNCERVANRYSKEENKKMDNEFIEEVLK